MKTHNAFIKLLGAAFVAVAALFASPAALAQAADAGDPEVNKLIAKCEHCHGARGAAPKEDYIPTLAGRPQAEIADTLAQFKHYERFCRKHAKYEPGDQPPVELDMCDVAGVLNERQMDQVGAYFASWEPPVEQAAE